MTVRMRGNLAPRPFPIEMLLTCLCRGVAKLQLARQLASTMWYSVVVMGDTNKINIDTIMSNTSSSIEVSSNTDRGYTSLTCDLFGEEGLEKLL